MLWHADIRLPDGCKLPSHRVNLRWSRHAQRARSSDRYGVIPYIASIPLSQFQVIEVETDNELIVKWVIRGHFDSDHDVVFVLVPFSHDEWFVKTVWFNLRTDVHATLDRDRYQQ
jgi:hypothetical protein